MFRRALRKFTLGAPKSAGRNSSGRITIWHRGGGAKRLQRRLDTKRTTSSMGVVERVEYDPNRSSRIALVRWVEGVQPRNPNRSEELTLTPPPKRMEPATSTVQGRFSFCSLPGMKSAAADHRTNKTSVRGLILSALSSPKAKSTAQSLSVGGSFTLPRMAVAGAKPAFFAPEKVEDGKEKEAFALSEVRKWRQQSPVWQHRIKRKAAVSWQSVRNQHNLGLAGAIEHRDLKPNLK